ncbi:MAG: MFS transporter, partial [Mesorhizobium sp.]
MTDTTLQLEDAAIDLDAAAPATWSATTWFAVLSLAATSFALVSAEFLPASLLTPMARDLGVSEGVAGQAVTATAIVGAIAAPTMAIITRRMDRRLVMWMLTAFLILSNL